MTTAYLFNHPLEHAHTIAAGGVRPMETALGLSTALRDDRGFVGHSGLRAIEVLTLDEADALAAARLVVGVLLGGAAVIAVGGGVLLWKRHRRGKVEASASAPVGVGLVEEPALAIVYDIRETPGNAARTSEGAA